MDSALNKVFYAKTAQNFYNMSKGYWRRELGNRKERRRKVDLQIQKSINILQAYGELKNFKKYHE